MDGYTRPSTGHFQTTVCPPATLYTLIVKPMFDRLFAATVLLFALPLFFAIAVLIRLDSPGPVLFRQQRTGLHGVRFTLFKFRTMVLDAEQRKRELADLNHHGPDSIDFKIKDDPRVTRIGAFLRRTSLDELPNLINVLIGDLSVVGPRPTSFGPETYAPHHLDRLLVRPGVTGLWQVSGRADVDFEERVALDISYIRRMSLLLDLRILWATVGRCIRPQGAY